MDGMEQDDKSMESRETGDHKILVWLNDGSVLRVYSKCGKLTWKVYTYQETHDGRYRPFVRRVIKLTVQQHNAMMSFEPLYDCGWVDRWWFGGRSFDGYALSSGIRRPRIVMDNLVGKGLITDEGWVDDERGNGYGLTETGKNYMRMHR